MLYINWNSCLPCQHWKRASTANLLVRILGFAANSNLAATLNLAASTFHSLFIFAFMTVGSTHLSINYQDQSMSPGLSFWLKSWRGERTFLLRRRRYHCWAALLSLATSGKLIWIVDQSRAWEVCVVNPNQFGWCKTLAGGAATPPLLSITVRCIVPRWNNCSAMGRGNQPWVGNWYPAIAELFCSQIILHIEQPVWVWSQPNRKQKAC